MELTKEDWIELSKEAKEKGDYYIELANYYYEAATLYEARAEKAPERN